MQERVGKCRSQKLLFSHNFKSEWNLSCVQHLMSRPNTHENLKLKSVDGLSDNVDIASCQLWQKGKPVISTAILHPVYDDKTTAVSKYLNQADQNVLLWFCSFGLWASWFALSQAVTSKCYIRPSLPSRYEFVIKWKQIFAKNSHSWGVYEWIRESQWVN